MRIRIVKKANAAAMGMATCPWMVVRAEPAK
jgi:hypothetical protein